MASGISNQKRPTDPIIANDFGTRVCRVLGMDASLVGDVHIMSKPGGYVELIIHRLLTNSEAAGIFSDAFDEPKYVSK